MLSLGPDLGNHGRVDFNVQFVWNVDRGVRLGDALIFHKSLQVLEPEKSLGGREVFLFEHQVLLRSGSSLKGGPSVEAGCWWKTLGWPTLMEVDGWGKSRTRDQAHSRQQNDDLVRRVQGIAPCSKTFATPVILAQEQVPTPSSVAPTCRASSCRVQSTYNATGTDL